MYVYVSMYNPALRLQDPYKRLLLFVTGVTSLNLAWSNVNYGPAQVTKKYGLNEARTV